MEPWLLKIETRFWDQLILMISQSPLVRTCFAGGYQMFAGRTSLFTVLVMIVCSVLGLLSGCAFYLAAFGG